MRYRPDIDGLRTIAVLPVVFYHAGYSAFGGGFVGVDVFFVISGYLITLQLRSSIEAGSFSILDFYERRIRRIFPALFVMIAGTLIAGGFILLPEDFKNLGDSAASASLFFANFHFWWTGDYFAEAEVRPLLHTWSLAVEEQFYIVFPPLLWLLYALFHRHWTWPLATLALGSFALSCWVVRSDPSVAFFWPHVRAWELLVGALLALGFFPVSGSRAAREIAGLTGISLIAWAVFTFDHDTLFPGESALLPCLGAMLVIHAGTSGNSLTSRVLGLPPLVWIGKLSYSLYLWHMPILVLWAYYNVEPLDDRQIVIAIGLSLGIATLSYFLVEQPFRKSTAGRTFVFASGAGMILTTVLAFGVISTTSGFPGRFSAEALRYANMMDKEEYFEIYDRGRCFLDYDQGVDDYDLEVCATPAEGYGILIWGDSYAAHLYPGLRELADASVYQYTATSCRPMIQGHRRCDPVYEAFPEVADRIEPDLIIISGSWSSRVRRYGEEEFTDRLRDSIRVAKATGAAVVVAGQSPTYPVQLPRLAFMFPIVRDLPEMRYDARDWRSVNQAVARAARAEGVAFHDFYDQCHGTSCVAFLKGEPLHWDGGHMTLTGSVFYTRALATMVMSRLSLPDNPAGQ